MVVSIFGYTPILSPDHRGRFAASFAATALIRFVHESYSLMALLNANCLIAALSLPFSIVYNGDV